MTGLLDLSCFWIIFVASFVLTRTEPSINATSVSNTAETKALDPKLPQSIESSNVPTTKQPYESMVTILSKPSQNTIRIPLRIGKALGPPFVRILNRRLSIRLDTSNDLKNSSANASDDILSMEIIVNNTSENRVEMTRFIMEPYNNSVDVTKTDMIISHTHTTPSPSTNYTNKGNMSSSSLFEKLTARILGLVATSTTSTTPETPTTSFLGTSVSETNSQINTKPLSSTVGFPRSQNQENNVPLLFQSNIFKAFSTRKSQNTNNNKKSNSPQDHGHQRQKVSEVKITTTAKPQFRRDERRGTIGGFLGNFINMFRETRKIISTSFRTMASRLMRFPQEQEEKRQRRIKSELKRDRQEE